VLTPLSIIGPIQLVLWIGLLVLKAFAFGDVVMRPKEAFPAADKQNKTMWMILVGLALLVHLLPPFMSPLSLLNLAGTIAAAVYVVGVRPAVREVGGRPGKNDGPYGPW
jgi:hypothetical protein